MVRRKKVTARPIGKGTILYSDLNWNRLTIEYCLNQYEDYFELYLFPRLIGITQGEKNYPYSLGITIQAQEISRTEQKSWLAGPIVECQPRVNWTRPVQNKLTKTCFSICDKLEDLIRIPKETNLAFKLKFKIKKLQILDFWITGSVNPNSSPDLLLVPNLIHYQPPLENQSIHEAYPLFPGLNGGGAGWWLEKIDEYLAPSIDHWPAIDWHGAHCELEKTNTESNPKTSTQPDTSDQSNCAYRNLFHHLKLLELQISGVTLSAGVNTEGVLGTWLTLINGGPAVWIAILVEGELVDRFYIDEQSGELNYFIPSTRNIQVRLAHAEGPILVEQLIAQPIVEVQYLKMGDGLWLQLTNRAQKDITTLISIWHGKELIQEWSNPIEARTTHKKFIANKNQAPWTFRVHVIDGQIKRMMSEFKITPEKQVLIPEPAKIMTSERTGKSNFPVADQKRYISPSEPGGEFKFPTASEAKLISESESKLALESESESEPESEPEPESKLTLESESEPESKLTLESKSEPESKLTLESESEPESKLTLESESELALESESEPEPESESIPVLTSPTRSEEEQTSNFIPFSSQPYIRPMEPVLTEPSVSEPPRQSLVMDSEEEDEEPTHSEIERMVDETSSKPSLQISIKPNQVIKKAGGQVRGRGKVREHVRKRGRPPKKNQVQKSPPPKLKLGRPRKTVQLKKGPTKKQTLCLSIK